MSDSNPSVELPGVADSDRDPIVRRRKKGGGGTPLRPFFIMGGIAVVMVAVLGISWVQSMKPQTPERASAAPVAANMQNRGIAGDEDPTAAYRALVAEENRRESESALSGGDRRAVVPPLLGERNVRAEEPVVTFNDPPAAPARGASPRPQGVDAKQVQALVSESRRLLAHSQQLAAPLATSAAPLLVSRASASLDVEPQSSQTAGPEVPLFVVQSAVLETGANSDYPAPVVMRITAGPLRGARVVGDFRGSASQGASDRIQLRASRVEVGGVVYQTDGLAVDPGTRIPAIEGNINRHLARNILARGSVAFLLGYAGGVTSGATRTSFSADGGIIGSTIRTGDLFRAEASREAASAASEIRIRQPTVTVPAGTPVGVVFLEPLRSRTSAEETRAAFVAGAPLDATPAPGHDGVGDPLEFSTVEEP